MTDLFKTASLFVMTPECYDQYFLHFNFYHGECMKSTISKTLGFLIVTLSITVKAPQILKIITNKSGEGISLTGCLLELFSVTCFASYSYLKQFPFNAWADGMFVGLQTATIFGLILYYKKQFSQLVTFLCVFAALVVLIFAKVIPISFFWLMQVLNLPLIVMGKGAQAYTNYQNQSTGQLSAITCILLFGGAAARVFTSIQETGDTAVILTFVVATLLNGFIVFQLFYYAKSGQKKGKGKGKGKSKGNKAE